MPALFLGCKKTFILKLVTEERSTHILRFGLSADERIPRFLSYLLHQYKQCCFFTNPLLLSRRHHDPALAFFIKISFFLVLVIFFTLMWVYLMLTIRSRIEWQACDKATWRHQAISIEHFEAKDTLAVSDKKALVETRAR